MKQPSQSPRKNRTWMKVAAVIALPVIGIVLFILVSTAQWQIPIESSMMTNYLNTKYGQDFAVSNVRITGRGLGVSGAIVADAYPKNDPSLKFEIGKSTEKPFSNNYSSDTFLATLWTRQESAAVDSFLRDELPGTDDYKLAIGIGPEDKLYRSIHGTTPSFSDILRKGETGFSLLLTVESAGQTTPSEPSAEQLARAFKVVSFVKQINSVNPLVQYAYRNSSFNQLYESTKTQAYQYGITIKKVDAINSINTPADLTNYFERIN